MKEALKLALEALELNNKEWKSLADSGDAGYWLAEEQDHYQQTEQAITAVEEALAQPEQEPVAWMTPDGEGFRIRFSPPVNDVPLGWDALYTTPPQRTWVGLSESDKRLINFEWQDGNGTATEIIDLVEAKLKEKNT
jgi:hypothetical protein